MDKQLNLCRDKWPGMLVHHRSYFNVGKYILNISIRILPHNYKYMSSGSRGSAQKVASLEEDL